MGLPAKPRLVTRDESSKCKCCGIPIVISLHIAATHKGYCSFYCQLVMLVGEKAARRMTAVLG